MTTVTEMNKTVLQLRCFFVYDCRINECWSRGSSHLNNYSIYMRGKRPPTAVKVQCLQSITGPGDK